MKNKNIVVWFSCGAASTVAAKLTVDKYGKDNNVTVVNNPIKEEHHDNIRFLKDVEKWLGINIVSATNEKYPNASIVEVFEKRKYMSGVAGAPCTGELKKQARYQYELQNTVDYHVLGFTYDEINRHERFVKFERSNVIPILIEDKITKQECFEILSINKIKLPEIYKHGFPNANCIGCVKATSPTYWNLVRSKFPEVFEQRAIQSREIGCKLVRVRGERKFLDELQPTDTGNKMKSWECGIFCNTE